MEDKNNFFLDGVPSNDDFEVPEKSSKHPSKSGSNPFSKMGLPEGITSGFIKKLLPPDLLSELEKEAAAAGVSLDKMIEDTLSMLNGKTFEGAMNDILGDSFENDKHENPEQEDDISSKFEYKLGDSKYLYPELFGSIKCLENPSLYEEFLNKFGQDTTRYFSEKGITDILKTSTTAGIITTEIESVTTVAYDDSVIVFFTKQKDPDKYGYFISVYKKPDGEFAAFIPEFRNTFKIDDRGNAQLLDLNDDEDAFAEIEEGKFKFVYYSEGSAAFASKFWLSPQNRVIISPAEFGVIKNLMPVIKTESSLLKVATIKANDTQKARELKIDGDFDPNKEEFDLYFNFGRAISPESLFEISSLLFKTNLNNCDLMRNTELHFVPGKYLYVNINLGDF